MSDKISSQIVINRPSNRLVIADYRPGAGGKFLLNALALAPGFVLQSAELAQQEIDNELTSQDKYLELTRRYTNVADSWDDLNLGCQQLFGVSAGQHLSAIHHGHLLKFDPVIDRLCVQSHMWFPLVSHSHLATLTYLRVWKQAQVIVFTNDESFTKAVGRRPYDEIDNKHQDLIHIQDLATVQEWDCEWFLDADTTVKNLWNLYQWFGLDQFDEDRIRQLRSVWLLAMERTKVSREN